jgi:hypothetical protein
MADDTGQKCPVCDTIAKAHQMKCSECKSPFDKKRRKKSTGNKSKQSKGKEKYKRRERKCSGHKDKYPTKQAAMAAGRRQKRDHGRELRAYKCKDCNAYHLTKNQTWFKKFG